MTGGFAICICIWTSHWIQKKLEEELKLSQKLRQNITWDGTEGNRLTAFEWLIVQDPNSPEYIIVPKWSMGANQFD